MTLVERVIQYTKTLANHKYYLENPLLFPAAAEFAKGEKVQNVQNVHDTERSEGVEALCIKAIFRALYWCENPRIVIFGQDPYPRKFSACGVAFYDAAQEHFTERTNYETSIDVIMNSFCRDFNCKLRELPPTRDFFMNTSQQGILWLNTSLTFDPGDPKQKLTHKTFWAPVIQFIVRQLPDDTIYVMIGKDAQDIKVPLKCECLKFGHPSKLNRTFDFNKFTLFPEIDAAVCKESLSRKVQGQQGRIVWMEKKQKEPEQQVEKQEEKQEEQQPSEYSEYSEYSYSYSYSYSEYSSRSSQSSPSAEK